MDLFLFKNFIIKQKLTAKKINFQYVALVIYFVDNKRELMNKQKQKEKLDAD